MQFNSAFAKGIVFILFIIACSLHASAQQTKDPDSLFSLARTAAFEGKDYPAAISYSRQALQLAPNYTDVVIFLGRIYTWNKQPDSARYYLDMALRQKPGMQEAYAAYADLEFWNKNDSAALEMANKGLQIVPATNELLLRKATILESMRQFEEAALLADSILRMDKKNHDARIIRTRLADFISKNRIGIKYDYAYFDEQFPEPWHLLSIDYTRQTKLGSMTGRVNYANRFAKTGLQYELESYPRISKTFYAYVAGAYSPDTLGVFPQWRWAGSLYANLPRAFEAEAGIRYLYFAGNATGTDLYTLYLGKYYKKFLFGVRTYLTPDTSTTTKSYNALARYYFGGADDYVHLSVGYGISPDDRQSSNQLNLAIGDLRTYRAEATLRKVFKRNNILVLSLSLLNQEFARGGVAIAGNQVQAGIGYIRRF